MTMKWVPIKAVKRWKYMTMYHRDGPQIYLVSCHSFQGYFEIYEDGKLVAVKYE